MSNLEESVRHVGAAWKQSAYYEQAEQFTHVFWGEHTHFRRLFARLDLTQALELACGHGRHAEQIADTCGRLCMMDIHAENLDFCRVRLKRFRNIEYHVNNGYDFQPLGDASLTAIFCYDAMVHFSPDLVKSYLSDTARVLQPGGRALFHHSNYPAPRDRHYGQNPHARNHMTRELFGTYAAEAGLKVEESVIIPWGHDADLDCITLVAR